MLGSHISLPPNTMGSSTAAPRVTRTSSTDDHHYSGIPFPRDQARFPPIFLNTRQQGTGPRLRPSRDAAPATREGGGVSTFNRLFSRKSYWRCALSLIRAIAGGTRSFMV